MILYLDNCCLNRPFDDQRQARIFIEAEAILAIIEMVDAGVHEMCRSSVLNFEVNQITDPIRLFEVARLADKASHFQDLNAVVMRRAVELHSLGIRRIDAAHIACAEALHASVFLTTDERLLSAARRNAGQIHIAVENPAVWVTLPDDDNG